MIFYECLCGRLLEKQKFEYVPEMPDPTSMFSQNLAAAVAAAQTMPMERAGTSGMGGAKPMEARPSAPTVNPSAAAAAFRQQPPPMKVIHANSIQIMQCSLGNHYSVSARPS